MDLNLKDKIIIVIGGLKGIGWGIMVFIVVEGVIFFIIGRNEEDVFKVVKIIRNIGWNVVYGIVELIILE